MWEILGIHDTVARVRMFIGEAIVDEDFPLPTAMHPSIPKTTEVYRFLLEPEVDARRWHLARSMPVITEVVPVSSNE